MSNKLDGVPCELAETVKESSVEATSVYALVYNKSEKVKKLLRNSKDVYTKNIFVDINIFIFSNIFWLFHLFGLLSETFNNCFYRFLLDKKSRFFCLAVFSNFKMTTSFENMVEVGKNAPS